MTLRSQWAVTMFAVVVLLWSSAASGQTAGKVTGLVRDATGGGIPGVAIVATHQATTASQNTVTASDGTYAFTLPPGTYTVTATVQGFRRVAQTIEVAADATRQLDFSLEAALTEEVTVTSMKRESAMLDVPFSVAAPTEQVLRDRGVEDIEGVAANVAGFTVQNLGPGQSQVAIRGVSAGQIVRDQPGVKEQVATYLDDS